MRISFSPAPIEPATTKKEIWAWYSYGFACEAYVVVALTSFIPITLEALASEQGHLYGTNEPCVSRPNSTETSITTERPRSWLANLTPRFMKTKALTVVSISAMADYGSYRKKQLIVFSTVGATATMLIGAVPFVWMAGALSVIANVSFGAGVVCFNAYLPLLVRNVDKIRHQREQIIQLENEIEFQSGHPDQVGTIPDIDNGASVENAQDIEQKTTLLAKMSSQLNEDKGHLMGQISAKGFAAGYCLFLPFWPHLSSAKELFSVAAYFGFLIGAVQSYCRSMYADLVPRGRESEFFGLYAITDKGSSWLGPLAVATITDITHEIRYAFIFLLVLLSLPIPIIYFGVNMNQGRLDAEEAYLEHQKLQAAGDQEGQDNYDESERLLSTA
ncbi:Autophagy protein 22 [Haplosporangium sp. Z 27]|nr:Autophagy protein 22 [Haplosporangium sp. Z 27]